MAPNALRISEVPVTTLGAFMEAAAAHSTSDIGDLARFAGFSQSTARKVVPSLESLGILKRENGGPYRVVVEGVRRGTTEAAKEQTLRRSLLSFRPFELLIEGIALGESQEEAIRKTLLVLGLAEAEAPKLRTLLRWGADLSIVEYADGQPRLIAELSPRSSDELGPLRATDVESEAKARLFTARRVGRDANHYLDEVDRALLADALLTYESEPRKSVDASGQALEDFLRHVAGDRGFAQEAAKANGAGQLANLLAGKLVIHNHHNKLVDAVATTRNATAHRKDKKTLAPWEMTSFGAFAALSTTLTAIRSIHTYVNSGRQAI